MAQQVAKLTLEIEVVTYGDYHVAPEIASEMLNRLLKLHSSLNSDYGYSVVRDATVRDSEWESIV